MTSSSEAEGRRASPPTPRLADAPRLLYSDPAVFAEEKRRHFRQSLARVAHESELAEPRRLCCAGLSTMSRCSCCAAPTARSAASTTCASTARTSCSRARGDSSRDRLPLSRLGYRLDGALATRASTQTACRTSILAGLRAGAGAAGDASSACVRQSRPRCCSRLPRSPATCSPTWRAFCRGCRRSHCTIRPIRSEAPRCSTPTGR